MAARTSSGERNALVESAPATARVSDYLQRWKVRFAGTDWVPWLILALAALLRSHASAPRKRRTHDLTPHFIGSVNQTIMEVYAKLIARRRQQC